MHIHEEPVFCAVMAAACVSSMCLSCKLLVRDRHADISFCSPKLCIFPSNHLPLDSRCINGCATLGSPFREFPVFLFAFHTHPLLPPLPSALLFSCSALASSHPTPTPSSISLRLSNSPLLRLLWCVYMDLENFLLASNSLSSKETQSVPSLAPRPLWT